MQFGTADGNTWAAVFNGFIPSPDTFSILSSGPQRRLGVLGDHPELGRKYINPQYIVWWDGPRGTNE